MSITKISEGDIGRSSPVFHREVASQRLYAFMGDPIWILNERYVVNREDLCDEEREKEEKTYPPTQKKFTHQRTGPSHCFFRHDGKTIPTDIVRAECLVSSFRKQEKEGWGEKQEGFCFINTSRVYY